MKLAILGAGDLGRQLAHLASVFADRRVDGFFDDTLEPGAQVAGIPVVAGLEAGTLDSLQQWAAGEAAEVLIGVGYAHLPFRASLRRRCEELGFGMPSLIAPTAWLDPSAVVGPGCVVHAGCSLDQGVRLSSNVFLNPGATLSHDVAIGADTILGPGVTLCGFVRVGERCFVGAGTTFRDRIAMGDDASSAAGAVVVRDVPAGALVVGVPARVSGP